MTEDIIDLIITTILSEIKGNIAIVVQITAIAFICAIYKGFEMKGSMSGEITRGAFLVEYGIIAALLCTSMDVVKNTAVSAIDSMVTAMNAVSPALLASVAYTGSVASTAGIGSSFVIATEIVANVIKLFFLPAAIIIAVLGLVDNISDKINITNLVNLVKNTVLWGMGIIMTVYIAVLSVQRFIAGSTDSAIKKTVKFAAGSMIPFVGQYLSDSMDAVSASAGAMSSATGTGAMITLITITMGPALKILIIAGLLKLASAIIQPVANERITKSINGTATAFSLVSGLTAVCAVIFTVTIGVFISLVVSFK